MSTDLKANAGKCGRKRQKPNLRYKPHVFGSKEHIEFDCENIPAPGLKACAGCVTHIELVLLVGQLVSRINGMEEYIRCLTQA